MLKKITENVEIHQTLPDTPNLTSAELKKEWDKGSKIIKDKFNELIDLLNDAQAEIYTKKQTTTITEVIPQNTNYTVPMYTKIKIRYEGCDLIKDINYIEVDSTHIQFKDWDVPIGSNIEILYE